MKKAAKAKVFETAGVILKEVSDVNLRPEQPEGARGSHLSLLKLCNRTKQKLRPQDPTTLDFQVCIVIYICIYARKYRNVDFFLKLWTVTHPMQH